MLRMPRATKKERAGRVRQGPVPPAVAELGLAWAPAAEHGVVLRWRKVSSAEKPRPSSARVDGSGRSGAPASLVKARSEGLLNPLVAKGCAPPGLIWSIEFVPNSPTYRLPELSKARPCGLLRPVSAKVPASCPRGSSPAVENVSTVLSTLFVA